MKVKGEIMGQNYIEEVFSGDKLINYCPYEDDKARFSFVGTNRQGENIFFPAELFIICIISDLKGCRLSCSL